MSSDAPADAWTEKFDRWWAESYGLVEQLNDGRTVRTVRRVASLAFMAGAAAEKSEFGNRLTEWFMAERERAEERARLHAEHDTEYDE